MFDIRTIESVAEVTSTVLGDREGALLNMAKEHDGETIAAVAGFVTSHLAGAGETLGLGELRRVTLVGGQQTTLLYVSEEAVLTMRADPRWPVVGIENKLDAVLGYGGSR